MKMKFLFKNKKGFIVPFSAMLATVILGITLGTSSILVKEIFFSRLNRDSTTAYYAADAAIECAVSIDDEYVNGSTGRGIFPYDRSAGPDGLDHATSTIARLNHDRATSSVDLTLFSLDKIYCAGVQVFHSNFSISPTYVHGSDLGVTSSFDMDMDLGLGNNLKRCAKVTINKTFDFRQIIARGYSISGTNCDTTGKTNILERAVVSETQY